MFIFIVIVFLILLIIYYVNRNKCSKCGEYFTAKLIDQEWLGSKIFLIGLEILGGKVQALGEPNTGQLTYKNIYKCSECGHRWWEKREE